MKKHLLPILFSFLFIASQAQVPFYHYGYSIGCIDADAATDHATDANGNILISGLFTGCAAVDLDPTAGTYTVTGTSFNRPSLIKLTANGQFVWGVKVAAGGQDITAEQVTTDAAGNVYVAGGFNGTATDFDPGAGTFTLASASGALRSIYLSKFNSAGTWQWTLPLACPNDAKVGDVKVGPSGDVYICGLIEGACDFDPSASTAMFTPSGPRDAFIAKYNSNGQYQWAFTNGSNLFCSWDKMVIDASENIYCTGTFQGSSIDMDPGAGTAYLSAPNTNYDLFIAKYNSAKQYQWAFKVGSSVNDETPGDLSVDASNNIYVSGALNGSGIDFDPGAGSALVNGAGGAGFLAKYSAAGAYMAVMWITGLETVYNTVDAAGNLYITGSYSINTDFDPTAGVTTLTNSAGSEDIFVAKYNSSFALQWAFGMGNSGYDYANSILVDPYRNVTICGWYGSTSLDLDPGVGVSTITNAGANDFFFARFSQSPDIAVIEKNGSNFSIGPNPTNGIFSVSPSQNKSYTLKVYNNLGESIYSSSETIGAKEINISQHPAGIYYLQLNSEDETMTIKLIKE